MNPDQEQADAQQDSPPAPPPPDPPVQENPTDTTPQSRDATPPMQDAPQDEALPTSGTVRIKYTAPQYSDHPIVIDGQGWDDRSELDVPVEQAANLLAHPGFSRVNATP